MENGTKSSKAIGAEQSERIKAEWSEAGWSDQSKTYRSKADRSESVWSGAKRIGKIGAKRSRNIGMKS